MAGEAPLIFKNTNGDKLTVASGGIVNVESGGAFQIAGTDVTAALAIAGIAASSAEVVVATKGVTAAENGKTFYINHATGFVTTLPTAALGLNYTFILKAAVTTTGGHTIVCPAAAALFKGHVLTNDVNSATDADFGTTGEATVTFVINKAVAGDRVQVSCDGTNWFVTAACSVFDAITLS